MEERLTLKVKRSESAKQFPMLHVAKEGDVGLDVAVALPFRDGYKEELALYYEECHFNGILEPSNEAVNEIKHGHIQINPNERALVPTGIYVECPKGYWIAVEARSSTSKAMAIVPKGVIDEGYRGEIFAQIINVGKEPIIVHHGDRLVQLIIRKNYTRITDIVEVDELSQSERGTDGFGSTGTSY